MRGGGGGRREGGIGTAPGENKKKIIIKELNLCVCVCD